MGYLEGRVRGRRVSAYFNPAHKTRVVLMQRVPDRSAQQVTERLDKLVAQIIDIQQPYLNGEKPVDVILVCSCWVRHSGAFL